jgi:hypothetical protein
VKPSFPGSPDPSLFDRDAVHIHSSILHITNRAYHSVIAQHVARSHSELLRVFRSCVHEYSASEHPPSLQPGLLPLTQRRVASCPFTLYRGSLKKLSSTYLTALQWITRYIRSAHRPSAGYFDGVTPGRAPNHRIPKTLSGKPHKRKKSILPLNGILIR